MTAVLAIGELLWDLLPTGPRLGGAPFNVVVHLQRLGVDTALLSGVGDDDLGRRALAEARALGVRTDLVEVVRGVPTGTVGVQLDAGGHPTYAIHTPAAYERLGRDPVATVRAAGIRPDAIVIGTLAQRFAPVRAATRDVMAAFPDAMRVYDVNLRDGCWTPPLVDELLRDATMVKLNAEEAGVLAGELDLPAADPAEFAAATAARYDLRVVCVTSGAAGATAWRDGAAVAVPGHPVDVVDSVGAGDAFTAAFLAALLEGRDLADAVGAGNALGAIVASRAGGTPSWTPADLEAARANVS